MDHSIRMKMLSSYDCKLREFLVGLITKSTNTFQSETSEVNTSSTDFNIFDELENKWKAMYDSSADCSLLLPSVPILLQGSSIEGGSLARLANPNLENSFEIEFDLNIVVGTVSKLQFESCFEPVDKHKGFFNYAIKETCDDDTNICIHLPTNIKQKIIVDVQNPTFGNKKYLSGLVLKELFHENQPPTENLL
ncbi:uncharacterized protein LOC136080885 isoform X2 [Hydra vulgaris]|uniref:Uncharacterized protein LOC136080885 isoform X2 n=1 Tax=Hydra vulgaris TaxID=6087 RepID=A0ABM4BYL5_HYDVU